MTTLSTFSEKEHQYHQYQARQEYLREQRTIQLELEQTSKALIEERQEKQAALQREEKAVQEKEAALAEIECLKSLLAKQHH